MKKLNMAKVNTLIRKGYLFAGVIMAVNMFVVNEMKAMIENEETKNKNLLENEKKDDNSIPIGSKKMKGGEIKDGKTVISKTQYVQNSLTFLLSYENVFNFFGGLFFSVANNYLKLWDYNPGGYLNLRIGCLGLRSKRLLNGMLQFEGNFNLGRGFLWLLLGAYNFIKGLTVEAQERRFYFTPLYVSTLVACCVGNHEFLAKTAHIVFFLVQGFVSIPLTLHFSKFSISIYLDSLIWGITGMILERKLKKEMTSNMEGEKNKIINDNNENENIQENNIKDINKEIEINPKEIETTNIDKKEKKLEVKEEVVIKEGEKTN